MSLRPSLRKRNETFAQGSQPVFEGAPPGVVPRLIMPSQEQIASAAVKAQEPRVHVDLNSRLKVSTRVDCSLHVSLFPLCQEMWKDVVAYPHVGIPSSQLTDEAATKLAKLRRTA